MVGNSDDASLPLLVLTDSLAALLDRLVEAEQHPMTDSP